MLQQLSKAGCTCTHHTLPLSPLELLSKLVCCTADFFLAELECTTLGRKQRGPPIYHVCVCIPKNFISVFWIKFECLWDTSSL